jgi:hypothetical protein
MSHGAHRAMVVAVQLTQRSGCDLIATVRRTRRPAVRA